MNYENIRVFCLKFAINHFAHMLPWSIHLYDETPFMRKIKGNENKGKWIRWRKKKHTFEATFNSSSVTNVMNIPVRRLIFCFFFFWKTFFCFKLCVSFEFICIYFDGSFVQFNHLVGLFFFLFILFINREKKEEEQIIAIHDCCCCCCCWLLSFFHVQTAFILAKTWISRETENLSSHF